jgi:hypothetical protein
MHLCIISLLISDVSRQRTFLVVFSWIIISSKGRDIEVNIKGTVARDFLAWVFFMDLLYMGLGFRG